MVTTTALNAVGGFTSAGIASVGNKSILGFKGHSTTPLNSLAAVVWEWENVGPIEAGSTLHRYPYLNLVVELAPAQFKILVVDPNLPAGPLNVGALISTGTNKWRFTHTPAGDANYAQVVNAFTAQVAAGIVPAMPILSPPVPVAAGAGPSWPSASFKYSDIVAAFPAARLLDAYTGDGGLPGPAGVATPTPAVMLVLGDSTFRRQRNVRLTSITINGQDA